MTAANGEKRRVDALVAFVALQPRKGRAETSVDYHTVGTYLTYYVPTYLGRYLTY